MDEKIDKKLERTVARYKAVLVGFGERYENARDLQTFTKIEDEKIATLTKMKEESPEAWRTLHPLRMAVLNISQRALSRITGNPVRMKVR